jgi:hypothetical protein
MTNSSGITSSNTTPPVDIKKIAPEKKDIVSSYLVVISSARGEKKLEALEGLAKHIETIGIVITEKKLNKDPRINSLLTEQKTANQKIKDYFLKEKISSWKKNL